MLTSEVKQKIDAARQVLVGKIPNPIGQVQEITNALIYKFMDDMDEKAVSMGGKRRYFSGDYEKYSWRTIMNPKIGAHERLNLYTEALSKMSENPNIPELFRNIFRNAYLPFNDPRTLTLFLNEVNFFDYKKTEELGDAYEYLLSIMGSQGDAGQFRTPRHIIDFIVKAVNPTKDDSVLDPACGTAGFLISAYKHVMNKHDGINDDTGNPNSKEKLLTADEKNKLHKNYKGFDISDEMVKMSQVNLYLHGFPDPNIIVHDTLSSEDFWNDRYDIILANPPFMSPKGGIVPHSKFGVKSNRSEVLFVDYIVSHLKPKGRAGIIVPEGIIFHSGNAYKQLRKNLVEDGLYAVVSLPSGVFNPYAGVKTSILLFDNDISKQRNEMLFIKIENDGFDLGAQRKQIDKNDLPPALGILEKWKKGEKDENSIATYVKKSKLAENEGYNLSGERYRVANDHTNAKWHIFTLKELEESNDITLGRGQVISKKDLEVDPGIYPVYSSSAQGNGEFGQYGKYMFDEELITWSVDGGGRFFYRPKHKFSVTNVSGWIRINNPQKINANYLFLVLNVEWLDKSFDYVAKAHPSVIREMYQIPLPPLEIQEQIVKEVDGYQKIINGAKQVVDNWKPRIDVDPKWEKVRLGKILEKISDQLNPKNMTGQVYYIGLENIESNSGIIVGNPMKDFENIKSLKNSFKSGDILYGKLRPNLNKVWLADREGICSTDILVFRGNENTDTYFYWYLMLSDDFVEEAIKGIKGAQLPRVGFEYLKDLPLPYPPISIQKEIKKKVESERTTIDLNKKLIETYEHKIKDIISKLWEG